MLSRADGPARIVDVDAWESDPRLYPLIGELASHRPDYIFYTGGPSPKLFVIEVKGTSASSTAMFRQLARGVEQVATIGRVPGYQVRRVVIGTVVARGLTGYAVEVPIGSDREEREARRQVMAWRRRDLKPAPAGVDEDLPDGLRPYTDIDDLPVEIPRDDVATAMPSCSLKTARWWDRTWSVIAESRNQGVAESKAHRYFRIAH